MTFMLLRFDTGKYRVKGERDDTLDILLYFLNYDVGLTDRGVQSFKEWTLNPKWQETSSNVSSLEKTYDSIVIRDLFTEESDDQAFCEIKLQNFLNILDKWAEVGRRSALYLVLVDRGNGDISLEETHDHGGLSKL